MAEERVWNDDLVKIFKESLSADIPNIKIEKCKILKDLFLQKGKDFYSLQLGFSEQDIVFYEEIMDISEFYKIEKIKIHNIDKNKKNEIVIPKVICELKYDGINTHGLITYSNIAYDIKSIFPHCKYYLILFYKSTSSENKLLRSGKSFDHIFYFDSDSGKSKKYNKGDFELRLKIDNKIKEKYVSLITTIKSDLTQQKYDFVK